MRSWIVVAVAVVIITAVVAYQILNPECVRKFAHSEFETIPYIECEGD